MNIDTTKVSNIDNNIVLPATPDNSTLNKLQEDRWGNILNEQTLKQMNNNIRILKESLVEVINSINVLNLEDVKLRLKNLETDRDTIENIVNRKVSDKLTIGIEDRELNLKGTTLKFNNENVIEEKLIERNSNDITVGKNNIKLNLITTNDNKFSVNGNEFTLPSNNGFNFDEIIQTNLVGVSNNGGTYSKAIQFSKVYSTPPLLFLTVYFNGNDNGYDKQLTYRLGNITNSNCNVIISTPNINNGNEITILLYVLDKSKLTVVNK